MELPENWSTHFFVEKNYNHEKLKKVIKTQNKYEKTHNTLKKMYGKFASIESFPSKMRGVFFS